MGAERIYAVISLAILVAIIGLVAWVIMAVLRKGQKREQRLSALERRLDSMEVPEGPASPRPGREDPTTSRPPGD